MTRILLALLVCALVGMGQTHKKPVPITPKERANWTRADEDNYIAEGYAWADSVLKADSLRKVQTHKKATPIHFKTGVDIIELYSLDLLVDSLENENLRINPKAPLTLESFLFFYSHYEKECWADSTQLFREEGGKRHNCLVLGCQQIWDVPPTKVPNGFYHRQITFPGFIEYLRRQK
jgi:hypothetical protein